ncbi:MAG: electron transfer flavoprotein subunit beta/FixA family protein [Saprospiraceae bacterium]|nr:electron transfer flavoprotein subunit beta/FixA family protein [Saprospiraceae bacterium]
MNILVCVSKTPDTTSKISFSGDGKEYNGDGVTFIMNPYDEWYALVKAIELVEQHGGNVTTITVGDASNDIIIRKALAIGANDAIRVDAKATDSNEAAFQIVEVAKQKNYDLILLGKETIDYNGSVLGSLVAAQMDLPYISYGTKLETSDNGVYTVTREIEGGEEVCEVAGPLVISAAKGMAEQRIPNMKGIMMSKSKPLVVVPPAAYDSKVSVVSFELPVQKKGVKMIDPENMDELVRLLHEEAKVI